MTNSRRKGARGEHEWAQQLPGGAKISRTGYEGPDVSSLPLKVSGLTVWEVKRRAALPGWLQEWQTQALREHAAIAFREDRGDWWVMVPAEWLEGDLA